MLWIVPSWSARCWTKQKTFKCKSLRVWRRLVADVTFYSIFPDLQLDFLCGYLKWKREQKCTFVYEGKVKVEVSCWVGWRSALWAFQRIPSSCVRTGTQRHWKGRWSGHSLGYGFRVAFFQTGRALAWGVCRNALFRSCLRKSVKHCRHWRKVACDCASD